MKEVISKYKGPVGDLITGVAAGYLVGRGYYKEGVYISALVQVRQSVSWLHKKDKVGRDMFEHMVGVGIGLGAALVHNLVGG